MTILTNHQRMTTNSTILNAIELASSVVTGVAGEQASRKVAGVVITKSSVSNSVASRLHAKLQEKGALK